ncbi:hypothetical protein D3C77_789370 [compost metagenome]
MWIDAQESAQHEHCGCPDREKGLEKKAAAVGSVADPTVDKDAYLPMQKLEKIRPSKSSELNAPVISPRAC